MIWKAYLDGQLLGSNVTQQNDQIHLIEANLGSEINKTGSFSCKILPTHQLRNKIFKMRSQIEVFIDDDTEMKGRVIDTNEDLDGNLNISFEGSLAYLLDSNIDSYEEVSRTPRQQLQWIINQHNGQVEDYKHFLLGNVTVAGADKSEEFNNTSDQSSLDAINSGLVNRFGGHLFVRYSSGSTYLDWIAKDTGSLSSQKFKAGVNIRSLTRQISPDDIFTVLKPVGADGLTIESVNGGSKYIRNEEAIAEYGIIIRSENFSHISDAKELLEKGKDYIKKNYYGLTDSISINAVDLHILDGSIERFRMGNRMTIVADPIGLSETYTCSAINLDLINPENSDYTLGTLKQSFTDNYSSYKNDTSQSISDTNSRVSGNSKAIESNAESIGQLGKDLDIAARNITINAERIEANANEIKLKASAEHVDRIDKTVYGDDEGDNGLVGKTAELFSRVNTVEIDLNGEEGSIGLKAFTQELYGDLTTLDGIVDRQGERITSAEIDISSMKGEIALRVTSKEFNEQLDIIDNEIRVNREGIALKVDKNGVIGSINVTPEEVKIAASRVVLSGYVTMSEFEAQKARIDRLSTSLTISDYINVGGRVTISSKLITAPAISVSETFKFQGSNVNWQSQSVVTSVSLSTNTQQRLVMNGVGSPITINYVESASLSRSSTTIYYLG